MHKIAFTLILAAMLIACGEETPTPVALEPLPAIDTPLVGDAGRARFDSVLHYFRLQMDYYIKRNEAEIKYLRTGRRPLPPSGQPLCG